MRRYWEIDQTFAQPSESLLKKNLKEKLPLGAYIIFATVFISYPIINESYTSKCSFYDSEEIGYHNKYLGERIKRGLYETKEKRIVNADINGALNILKKSKP